MVDRIKKIMEYKQMSPTAFADTIDINRSSLTHIFSGRNQPSLDVAKKILTAFPDISTEWLVMGIGDMVQSGTKQVSNVIMDNPPISVSTVDNMQQTDLFAAIEMAEALSTEPVKMAVETPKSEPKPNIVATPVVRSQPEPGPEPVTEPELRSVANINSESVDTPVPVRNRVKNQESHISARESKRDRISNSQSDKKISKIIFFYDDRSFEIYTPN